jgi:hypothetical protein
MQENIQEWFELDEGDHLFIFLTEEGIASLIFFLFIFVSTAYIIKFSICLFSKYFFYLLGLYFATYWIIG